MGPEEYSTYFRVLETEDEYFPYHKKYHAFWVCMESGYKMNTKESIIKMQLSCLYWLRAIPKILICNVDKIY